MMVTSDAINYAYLKPERARFRKLPDSWNMQRLLEDSVSTEGLNLCIPSCILCPVQLICQAVSYIFRNILHNQPANLNVSLISINHLCKLIQFKEEVMRTQNYAG